MNENDLAFLQKICKFTISYSLIPARHQINILQIMEETGRISVEKVKHLLKDVVGIVFFAVLAGNDEWTEIADFAADEKETLHKYLELWTNTCTGMMNLAVISGT